MSLMAKAIINRLYGINLSDDLITTRRTEKLPNMPIINKTQFTLNIVYVNHAGKFHPSPLKVELKVLLTPRFDKLVLELFAPVLLSLYMISSVGVSIMKSPAESGNGRIEVFLTENVTI